MMPLLRMAVVAAHDSAGDGMTVSFGSSGQIPGYHVRVLHYGAADAVRVSQRPLPGVGTWGLVAFVNNDIRNGVWLGAYYPSQVDAVVGTQAPFTDYEAHWSGFWRLLDMAGQFNVVFPDGTSLTVSESGEVPVPTRNVVGPDQKQVPQPFTQEQRVPSPPSPFQIVLRTAGGVTLTIQDGNVILDANLYVTGEVIRGYGTGDSVTLGGHNHPQAPDSHGDTEEDTGAPIPGT